MKGLILLLAVFDSLTIIPPETNSALAWWMGSESVELPERGNLFWLSGFRNKMSSLPSTEERLQDTISRFGHAYVALRVPDDSCWSRLRGGSICGAARLNAILCQRLTPRGIQRLRAEFRGPRFSWVDAESSIQIARIANLSIRDGVWLGREAGQRYPVHQTLPTT